MILGTNQKQGFKVLIPFILSIPVNWFLGFLGVLRAISG